MKGGHVGAPNQKSCETKSERKPVRVSYFDVMMPASKRASTADREEPGERLRASLHELSHSGPRSRLLSGSGWPGTHKPIEQKQQHRAQDRHHKSCGLTCCIPAESSPQVCRNQGASNSKGHRYPDAAWVFPRHEQLG